jgi:hypothetical protein
VPASPMTMAKPRTPATMLGHALGVSGLFIEPLGFACSGPPPASRSRRAGRGHRVAQSILLDILRPGKQYPDKARPAALGGNPSEPVDPPAPENRPSEGPAERPPAQRPWRVPRTLTLRHMPAAQRRSRPPAAAGSGVGRWDSGAPRTGNPTPGLPLGRPG